MMDNDLRSALSRDDMEHRRLDAAGDLLRGVSQAQVARKYGVSRTTTSRWNKALGSQGVESLKKRKATGRPSRLTPEQLAGIAGLLQDKPAAFGLDGDRWTTARLAQAIQIRFGVQYDPDHVGRLMHRLGLRSKRRQPVYPTGYYAASRYSPNTDLSRSAISPTLA